VTTYTFEAPKAFAPRRYGAGRVGVGRGKDREIVAI